MAKAFVEMCHGFMKLKFSRQKTETKSDGTKSKDVTPTDTSPEERKSSTSSISSQRAFLRDNRPEFTDEEKVIVLTTWKIISADISKVGVVTFLRLFEEYPDVQQLFVAFRGMSSRDLRGNAMLREHSMRVMGTVEKCLARIDDWDKLEHMLCGLGQRHVTYNTRIDYMDLIGPIFLKVIEPTLGDQWTDDVENAWSNLFKLISHVMKEYMIF